MTTTDTTTTTAPLQDQTPAQIDAELSRLGYQRAVLFARVDGLRVVNAHSAVIFLLQIYAKTRVPT